MRICSLLPSATEIAFAVGLGDAVVGVTHECDYPPEARKKLRVVKSAIDPEKHDSRNIDSLVRGHLESGRSLYTIDVPRLQQACPDLILTQGLCEVCALDYREVEVVARSLPEPPRILSLNPTCLADVLGDIGRVGEAAGKTAEARELCESLKRRIETVRAQTEKLGKRPRVACIEWLDPLYAAGHWVPEMVELAGGTDGLGKKGKPSEKISWQRILEWDPEVVVLMPCGFTVERTLREVTRLQSLAGWSDLNAVRAQRVFAVDGHAYFNRSGPRLVDGLEILARIIHPEIFSSEMPDGVATRVA